MSASQEFSPNQLSDYLPGYYGFLFPHNLFYRWLSYGNKGNHFENREFSFTLPGDIYIRFNSYDNMTEMRNAILARLPIKIDIGAIYNCKPKNSKRLLDFHPQERELVFDIDMTDYDDVRTCCRGADICHSCWMFMIVAAKIINGYLVKDFGFKHLLWVYSGRRGIHCWVADERARKLNDDLRDAVASFISVIIGGEFKAKKVDLNGSMHPSIHRSLWHINQYFNELMIQKQKFLDTKDQIDAIINLCPDAELKVKLKEMHSPNYKNSAQRWQVLRTKSQEFYNDKHAHNRTARLRHRYFVEEIELQLCYPRLDINVTKGLNHLLKIPFSIHPKTGRVCVPIDINHIDEFDPFQVPRVDELCRQMDAIRLPAGEADADQVAEKTRLAPYIQIFNLFVSQLNQD